MLPTTNGTEYLESVWVPQMRFGFEFVAVVAVVVFVAAVVVVIAASSKAIV